MKKRLGLIIAVFMTLGFSQAAHAVFVVPPPSVPEPGTLSLLLVGGACAGVALYLKSRNRRK